MPQTWDPYWSATQHGMELGQGIDNMLAGIRRNKIASALMDQYPELGGNTGGGYEELQQREKVQGMLATLQQRKIQDQLNQARLAEEQPITSSLGTYPATTTTTTPAADEGLYAGEAPNASSLFPAPAGSKITSYGEKGDRYGGPTSLSATIGPTGKPLVGPGFAVSPDVEEHLVAQGYRLGDTVPIVTEKGTVTLPWTDRTAQDDPTGTYAVDQHGRKIPDGRGGYLPPLRGRFDIRSTDGAQHPFTDSKVIGFVPKGATATAAPAKEDGWPSDEETAANAFAPQDTGMFAALPTDRLQPTTTTTQNELTPEQKLANMIDVMAKVKLSKREAAPGIREAIGKLLTEQKERNLHFMTDRGGNLRAFDQLTAQEVPVQTQGRFGREPAIYQDADGNRYDNPEDAPQGTPIYRIGTQPRSGVGAAAKASMDAQIEANGLKPGSVSGTYINKDGMAFVASLGKNGGLGLEPYKSKDHVIPRPDGSIIRINADNTFAVLAPAGIIPKGKESLDFTNDLKAHAEAQQTYDNFKTAAVTGPKMDIAGEALNKANRELNVWYDRYPALDPRNRGAAVPTPPAAAVAQPGAGDDGKIAVISPAGVKGRIPRAQLAEALQSGYKQAP